MARILIVDDHATNREFLVTLVNYQGHESLTAGDGAEALALVQAEHPDLVICDLLMPTMDGYEFVRQLRVDRGIAHTPVIFYSAYYLDPEARGLAKTCGVSRILQKPCEPGEILQAIDQTLAQIAESESPPIADDFDREHLRLMTDMLSEKVETLQRANQRFSTLTELNLQLASERDPHTLLDKVCVGARELIGASYAVLCVAAGKNTEAVYWTVAGIDPAVIDRLTRPRLESGLLGQVVTGRRPHRMSNPGGDPLAAGLPPDYPPVHSLLAGPIMSLDSVYGWLCLVDKLGAEAFNAEDEQLLSIHAAQVGRIYENGSLYKELQRHVIQLEREISERQQAEVKIRRLNRVYALLSGINTLIVRVRDREELFREACRIAFEHGGFGVAWIGLVDPDTGTLRTVAQQGLGTDFPRALSFPISTPADRQPSPALLALKEGKPLIDNDILSEPQQNPVRQRAIALGYRSLVVLPLVIDKTGVGVIFLYAMTPGFFDDEEMRLLTELAGDLSFALDHLAKTEKLDYLAYHDVLTGLANRTLFRERLEQQLSVVADEEHRLAVLMVDIDQFRDINNSLGRQAGDELLRQVAERLLYSTRDPKQLARFSADLFGVILRDLRQEADIARRLEELDRHCFGEPFQVGGTLLRTSAKTGIAFYPGDGAEADSLLRNAEVALKKAKASGERHLFYTQGMTERVAERLALENRLREALDLGEYVLHYQPKVDLQSGRISGLEALIRWQSPELGMVPPATFISVLEEMGLIRQVGQWVTEQAAADYRELRARDLDPPRIAINVSAVQFRQKGFAEALGSVLVKDDCDVDLDLEITESLIIEDSAGIIEKLNAIRSMGVGVALDDFGTGFSSLAYLVRLPIDCLKIDRAFITDMTRSADNLAIVSAVISLAHSLNLKVVAEGVETEEQAKLLRLLRCDEMQGYYFSRPLAFEQLSEFLSPVRSSGP